jgi:hypothetical protein
MEALFEAARAIPLEIHAVPTQVSVSRGMLRVLLTSAEEMQRMSLREHCCVCGRILIQRSPWNPENHDPVCAFRNLAGLAGLTGSHSDHAAAAAAAQSEVAIYAPYVPVLVTPTFEEGTMPRADLQAPVPAVRSEIVPSREGEDE